MSGEAGWVKWLAPGETRLERMEREFRDCQSAIRLLVEERRKREQAERERDEAREALDGRMGRVTAILADEDTQ